MGYQINSTWTELRRKDIEALNKIIDDQYCNELEIGRKLNLMEKLNKAFEDELKHFNFDVVLKFMHDNNWEWSHYENGKSFNAVPTKEYMIEQLRNDFLKHCMFNIIELGKSESSVGSGGLILDIGIHGSNTWCNIYFDIAHFIKD